MQYSAGQDIDTKCTRCKLELAHTVIAAVNGIPARVKCNTCHSERKYRPPRGSKTTSTTKRRTQGTAGRRSKTVGGSVTDRSSNWAEIMAKADVGGVAKRDYNMRETFDVGQVVMHRKFGGGVVEAIVDNKIRVCFADGERLLIHGRS